MSVYRLVLLSAAAVLIACTGLVIGADLSQTPHSSK